METRLQPDEALTDEAVVRLVLEGQGALFEVLVRRHNQRVYRAVRAVLRDDAEAEDVMQHAYVAAWAQLARFNGASRFSTWLVRIALNEALARLRKRGRFVELVQTDADDQAEAPMKHDELDPEQAASARELGRVLESLIEELPTHFRTVFVLREVEGMSTGEVAQALELSEDNVKARLHRAKVALRNQVSHRLGSAALQVWRFEAPRCDVVVREVMARVGSRPPR